MTVRVRYAPSPTGAPHLGNIRTALFNILFARKRRGRVVIRIEDTDRARSVEGSIKDILDSLRWLKLSWDEGPIKQSNRLGLYQKAARKLMDLGFAYPCFCTSERLATMRKEQQKKKQPPRYDRHCLTLPKDEVEKKRAARKPYVIRMKIPREGTTAFDDHVRGHVEFQNAVLDDQVILKSDGYPTYHLAVVVDDQKMNITHVIRAEEWLSSTPKHLLLYQFFGWKPPEYAHVPMIVDTKKAKLSKRRGAKSVLEYRDAGYLPEAVINYLATLGWQSNDAGVILSLDELAAKFSLKDIQKNPAVFAQEKMDWLNGRAIRALSDEELLDRLDPFLEKNWDRAVVKQLVPITKTRITTLKDFVSLNRFFFDFKLDEFGSENEPLNLKSKSREEISEAIDQSIQSLKKIDVWKHDQIERAMRALAKKLDWKTSELFMLLRIALSRQTITPPLFESMVILGKEATMERLEKTASSLSSRAKE